MQLAVSLLFVLVGIALTAVAASRVEDLPLHEARTDAEWTQRHRVVAILRAGSAVFKQEPGTGQNTRTAGLLFGGVLLVLLGIAYLFV